MIFFGDFEMVVGNGINFFFFADWELLHGFWRGFDQICACPRPLIGTHNCLQLRLHQCINDGDGNHRW
jgi:hypothetical protein